MSACSMYRYVTTSYPLILKYIGKITITVYLSILYSKKHQPYSVQKQPAIFYLAHFSNSVENNSKGFGDKKNLECCHSGINHSKDL